MKSNTGSIKRSFGDGFPPKRVPENNIRSWRVVLSTAEGIVCGFPEGGSSAAGSTREEGERRPRDQAGQEHACMSPRTASIRTWRPRRQMPKQTFSPVTKAGVGHTHCYGCYGFAQSVLVGLAQRFMGCFLVCEVSESQAGRRGSMLKAAVMEEGLEHIQRIM